MEPTLKTPLRGILVGCGGFANNYLPLYGQLPGVRIVQCVDASLEVANALKTRIAAEAASDQFADAVKAPADFAVVSTPNFLHLEQTRALLQSGKHVLLQKPMARSLPEARELYASLQAHPGSRLGLYMSMLDFGLWWNLRESLASGAGCGQVVQVGMRLGHTGGLLWSARPDVLWRFSRDKTGGGAFIMLGVHYIHFLRWLLGLRITRVVAQAKNLHCPRVEGEDVFQLQGELSNGGLVQLSVAWNSQGEHLAIYGTKGSFVYLDNELLRIHAAAPWKTPDFNYDQPGKWQSFPGIVPPPLSAADNPCNQHRQFVEALQAGKPLTVPAIEGLWDMQVADAAYRSAETGQWQTINYIEPSIS